MTSRAPGPRTEAVEDGRHGLLANIAFYGLILIVSLFYQRGQHLSALQSGLAFALSTVAILAAKLLAGRLDGWTAASQEPRSGPLNTARQSGSVIGVALFGAP